MGTLEEALAEAVALSDEELITPVNDILMIDPETREIYVPETEKLFGVKFDVDVERKYFKCPKIVGDNVDLYQHKIYVVYQMSDEKGNMLFGAPGMYWCNDMEVDETGDYITFSWLLSGNIFENSGVIAFKIIATYTDTETGTVKTRWNTIPAYGTVKTTLSNGEEIAEQYADVITQLLEEMESVREIATPEAMQGYVEQYLQENPPSGMTEEEKEQLNKNTEDISSLSEEIANIVGSTSSGGVNSTARNLLIYILRSVGTYTDADIENKITALDVALKQTSDSGDSDSGDSGDITYSILADGLLADFDYRNCEFASYNLTGWGTVYKVDDKTGNYLTFGASAITGDNYGIKDYNTREIRAKSNEWLSVTMGEAYTINMLVYSNGSKANPSVMGMGASSNIDGMLAINPKYVNTSGSAVTVGLTGITANIDLSGYYLWSQVVDTDGTLKIYINGVLKQTFVGSDYTDFSYWNKTPLVASLNYNAGYQVATSVYSKALSADELVYLWGYYQTLEVVA